MFKKLCVLMLSVSIMLMPAFSSYADELYLTDEEIVEGLSKPGINIMSSRSVKKEDFQDFQFYTYTVNGFKYNTNKMYLPMVSNDADVAIAAATGGTVLVDTKCHVHNDVTGMYNTVDASQEDNCTFTGTIKFVKIDEKAYKAIGAPRVFGYSFDSTEYWNELVPLLRSSALSVATVNYYDSVHKISWNVYYTYDGAVGGDTLKGVAMGIRFPYTYVVEAQLNEEPGSAHDLLSRVKELRNMVEGTIVNLSPSM